MTDHTRVRKWMEDIGQEVHQDRREPVPVEIMTLRHKLESEEHVEMLGAMYEYLEYDGEAPTATANLVKELCDKIVVAHGFLTALGVDGDRALGIVMDENEAKTEYAYDRGDGKRVVPPEVKTALKQFTKEQLLALVTGRPLPPTATPGAR